MAYHGGKDEPTRAPMPPVTGARHGRPAQTQGTAAEAVLLGRRVSYVLKVSPRARNLRLVIRHDRGLEVVVPRGTGRTRIEEVLRDKARWVLATLDRVALEAAAAPPPLADGYALPFAGRSLTLALRMGAPAGRFRAILLGDTLTLTIADGSQATVRAALETWYRRRAREVFAERLAVCNAVYGYTYGRVSIKEQKSRWGSCSRKGNLNFNWRLLLAPLPVLDYVVTHELAHLKELNHSHRFWQLVSRGCPDHLAHRSWLRKHGRTLRF